METCSSCGASLAVRDVLYTAEGKVVCAACNEKADLVATDKRAAGNIVKAAWGSLGAGAISVFAPLAMLGVLTYFFIASAWISGVFAIQSLARSADNDRFTKHLTSGQRVMVWVCSGLGLVLGFVAAMYGTRIAMFLMSKS